MPLELWIPESARERTKVRRCLICGMRFPYEQRSQWQRHVIACDRKHPEVLEAAEAARTSSAFTSIYDTEQFEWVRKRAFERKEIRR